VSVLADLRADVAQRLEAAGLTVYTYVPSQIHPPLIIVRGGSPYVESPDIETFDPGLVKVNIEVLIFALGLDNESAVDDLDELIGQVVTALKGYAVEEVYQPSQMGNDPILGTRITVSHLETL
jgi:hypothetical protein